MKNGDRVKYIPTGKVGEVIDTAIIRGGPTGMIDLVAVKWADGTTEACLKSELNIIMELSNKLTSYEFSKIQEEELAQIPEAFRAWVSYYSYEKGHSAGYEEILLYVHNLVSELVPVISKYNEQILGIATDVGIGGLVYKAFSQQLDFKSAYNKVQADKEYHATVVKVQAEYNASMEVEEKKRKKKTKGTR